MTAAATAAHPALTPQELAAVVAAVELVWPAPPPAAPVTPGAGVTDQARKAWRFSGRWWTEAGPGIQDAQAKSGWATST